MFAYFEKLIQPYPEALPPVPPRGLARFVWTCSAGLRGHILMMTLLTAAIGVFEAILFGFMGRIVDWLGQSTPQTLWADHQNDLFLLAAVLLASPLRPGAIVLGKLLASLTTLAELMICSLSIVMLCLPMGGVSV